MKKLRFIAALCAATMALSVTAFAEEPPAETEVPDETVAAEETTAPEEDAPAEEETDDAPAMRDITTMELVKDMGLGINLGNTFESCGSWINGDSVTNFETAWGSIEITEDIIKGIADAGFGVLRIPVAWSNMMDEDYTIAPEYIDRVKEVVDWTVDSGMYAIVNIHWDGGWWDGFATDEKDECMKKYTRIWEQLSEAFGEYNDYVMFESLNEEGAWDSIWNRYGGSRAKKPDAYALLNEINQKFVDIVRASGGNNAERHLLIAGYGTDATLTCDELFEVPNDPMNRCAVSIHYYTPSTFCILEKDASWGKAQTEWGSQSDIDELNKYMTMIKERFIDNGIPVIMGEYGVAAKSNKTKEMINYFNGVTCKAMVDVGICPVLWDTYDRNNPTGCYYNRGTLQMNDPELQQIFADILAGTYEPDMPETEAPETDAPATEAPETDAPETDAPETEAPADTTNPDTGSNGIAVTAGVAVIAAAAVLVTKKIKK
ncbi:MAG: cellulase family glycosylhydrolase [Eubacterium sp.]|nr:cellulase family glycosylhydrolase [Eubacterium sp.]